MHELGTRVRSNSAVVESSLAALLSATPRIPHPGDRTSTDSHLVPTLVVLTPYLHASIRLTRTVLIVPLDFHLSTHVPWHFPRGQGETVSGWTVAVVSGS